MIGVRPIRPAPREELVVVWNGTLDRDHAKRQQRPATPPTKHHQTEPDGAAQKRIETVVRVVEEVAGCSTGLILDRGKARHHKVRAALNEAIEKGLIVVRGFSGKPSYWPNREAIEKWRQGDEKR